MTTDEVNDLEAMALIIFVTSSVGLVCTYVIRRPGRTTEDRRWLHFSSRERSDATSPRNAATSTRSADTSDSACGAAAANSACGTDLFEFGQGATPM